MRIVEAGRIDEVDRALADGRFVDVDGGGAWFLLVSAVSLEGWLSGSGLHDSSPWPICALGAKWEMKVVLPDPVTPITPMTTSFGLESC